MKKLLLPLIVFAFISCSKDKEPEPTVTIDSSTLELKYDKEHQYTLTRGTGTVDASTFVWTSSDTLVGKVDKNGKFKARKIGETTVKGVSGGQSVESKITVSPYITSFKEPNFEFGITSASLKSKETRKLRNESETLLIYEGDNSTIRSVLYLIENGKMKNAAILFENSSAMVTLTTTFFKERYPRYGVVDNNVAFINDARNMSIIMGVDDDLGFYALYSYFDKGGRVEIENPKQLLKQALEK